MRGKAYNWHRCIRRGWDHPPHVRGKAQQLLHVHAVGGITPAYAGKRSQNADQRESGQDHPRMCGEKGLLPVSEPQRAGSPPHVRGKDSWLDKLMILARITPACAGKSGWPSQSPPPHQDHPRMCGEKPNSTRGYPFVSGSPPHVRGKGALVVADRLLIRITPACAGKSSVRQRVLLSLWDHPRMCGEKTGFGKSAFTKSGSPPHVRGKGERKTGKTRRVGITPACAGKRMHQWCRKIANWDHPRMCGEKPLGLAPAGWPSGSPPHVRGKVDEEHIAEGRIRITPAYAGKSLTGNG